MFEDTTELKSANIGELTAMIKAANRDLQEIKIKLERLIRLEEQSLQQSRELGEIKGRCANCHEKIMHLETMRKIILWILGGGGFVTSLIGAYLLLKIGLS
jgi:predicted RNase H-like nuclease (RuvC/YqgF family)